MNLILTAMVNGALLSVPIALAVWLVFRVGLGRVVNAATRYVIWWATLAVVMALPLLFMPWPSMPRPNTPPAIAPIHENGGVALPVAKPAATPAVPLPPPPILDARATPIPQPKPAPRLRIEISWTRWLLTAWMGAAALLLLRLFAGWLLLARIGKRAVDAPANLRERAAEWMASVGSRRRVRIAVADIRTPVAIGPHRPTILIPSSLLEAMDAAELDQIGVHEAAHLARWDDYTLLAQRAVEALFALHPVVRWIARQIDLEREIACDDSVIASLGQPHSYATCLTRVVELSGQHRSLAAAAAADDRSHLSRRIDMLLDRTRHTGTRLLKNRLALMLAALAGLAWVASRSPQLVAFAAPLVRAVRQAAIRQELRPVLMLAPQAQETAQGFQGRVIEDSSGSPLASAELRFHKAGWRELAADLETGRDGRVRAVGLDPGEYTVDISKPNFVTATLDVRLPNDSFLVRLVRYGVITGEVLNEQGKALQGRILDWGRTIGSTRICLLAKSPADRRLRLVTFVEPESDGHFRIHQVAPGEYAVALYYYGMPDGSGMQIYPNTAQPRFFTFAGGEEYRDVNFTIVAATDYKVSGRVTPPTASDGEGYALALALPDQPALPLVQTVTEKGGGFHFDKVPTGTYDLYVAGPTNGYGAYDSTVKPNAIYSRTQVQVSGRDVDGLQITASPGHNLPLVVRGQGNGAPPEGCSQAVSVTAVSMDPWGILFEHNFVQATLGKEAVMPDLPAGRFRLEASDLGPNCYQVEQPIADLTGGTPKAVAIELAAAGILHGVLKPVPASAATYVVVLLEPQASSTSPARLASVDADGKFQISGLRPGRYRIAAQPAADAPKARWVGDFGRMVEIEIRGGSTTDLELPVAGGTQ